MLEFYNFVGLHKPFWYERYKGNIITLSTVVFMSNKGKKSWLQEDFVRHSSVKQSVYSYSSASSIVLLE